MALLDGVRWYLIAVLICISLIVMVSIFSCVFWSCNVFSEEMSFWILCPFFDCFFFLFVCFLIMSCLSCLCILDINPLSVASFANILFHSVGCLRFVYGFLCCGRTFKFNKVPFVYFCFYFHHSRRWIWENIAAVYILVFCLRVLAVILCFYCLFLPIKYHFISEVSMVCRKLFRGPWGPLEDLFICKSQQKKFTCKLYMNLAFYFLPSL